MIVEGILLLTLVGVCITLGMRIGAEQGSERAIQFLADEKIIRLIPLDDGDYEILSGYVHEHIRD